MDFRQNLLPAESSESEDFIFSPMSWSDDMTTESVEEPGVHLRPPGMSMAMFAEDSSEDEDALRLWAVGFGPSRSAGPPPSMDYVAQLPPPAECDVSSPLTGADASATLLPPPPGFGDSPPPPRHPATASAAELDSGGQLPPTETSVSVSD